MNFSEDLQWPGKVLVSSVADGVAEYERLKIEAGHLNETWHPNRINQWKASRAALFKLTGVFEFDFRTETLISMAHADQAVIVWSAKGCDLRAIGVDIESRGRAVSEAVLRRIRHPRDERSGIQLWSAKEAVYKALPRQSQAQVELSQIEVSNEFSAGFRVEKINLSGVLYQTEWNSHWLSFAWWK